MQRRTVVLTKTFIPPALSDFSVQGTQLFILIHFNFSVATDGTVEIIRTLSVMPGAIFHGLQGHCLSSLYFRDYIL